MKKCSRCGTEKDFSQFYRFKHGKDGFRPHCKQCDAARRATPPRDYNNLDPDRFDLSKPVGYAGAHHRVRRSFGSPQEHPCSGCGSKSRDWAYTHDCPYEMTTTVKFKGAPMEVRYSPDPRRYIPLCSSCHTKLDRHSLR